MLRIRHILFLCFCFAAALVKSQYNTEFLNYENTGRSISLNADFDAGSNGIQNALINKFLFGGYIDTKTKDAALSHMRGYNQLGVNLNYDISMFIGKNPKYDFLLGFKNQEIFNATYTKDFYQLLMYGNKPFLDKTANFTGTNINALRFQELKFGVIMHQVDSSAKIGISVSFLKGEQLFYVKANQNSSLYTNADGTELIFSTNFNMALSDTFHKKNVLSFNGVGASADIFFETPYKSRIGRQSVLTVNANNIGFIHWSDKSVQYSCDSVIKFNGYHVNNVLDLKDSTLQKVNTDSVLRKATNARREAFNTNIPTNLIIINKIYFSRQFAFNVGFRYIFHSNYKPYVFIEPEYKLVNRITVSVHVGYGGYTRLNTGLALTYSDKNWFFKLGSNSLQGYILPKQAFGQGVYFSIAKKFK
ncbi:MAG TPA: DUF5723 family protein [Bacteroidia bacterium]|jgi:hypothetical protein|nr:DUF5723 family protein [Bacteroidia bacterium]